MAAGSPAAQIADEKAVLLFESSILYRGNSFPAEKSQRCQAARVLWIAWSALVVSSLGVFAVTWIGIRNRTREIGTRRAIGAARSDILVQFFAEGSFGAVIGCFTGVAIAYAGLRVIDGRVNQPFLFSPSDAIMEALASITLRSALSFAVRD